VTVLPAVNDPEESALADVGRPKRPGSVGPAGVDSAVGARFVSDPSNLRLFWRESDCESGQVGREMS
jgi:hypothetical protein